MEFFDNIHNLLPAVGIQHGRRLIKDNALGPHGHYACYGNPLLLPSGKQMGGFLSLLIHVYSIQGFVHPLSDFTRFHSQVLRSEGYVILHDGRYQLIVGVLENHARRLSDLPNLIRVRRIPTLNVNNSLRRYQETVYVFSQGGFTRAVSSDNSVKASRSKLKSYMVHCKLYIRRIFLPVLKYQVFYMNDRVQLFSHPLFRFSYQPIACVKKYFAHGTIVEIQCVIDAVQIREIFFQNPGQYGIRFR